MTVAATQAELAPEQRLMSLAYGALLMGALDSTNPLGDLAIAKGCHEAALLLDSGRPVHGSEWAREVDTYFMALLAAVNEKETFEADPDTELDHRGRPRNSREEDVLRGTLQADVAWWVEKLIGLTR